MFERLESIEWDRWTHAYGSATDLPALIRAVSEETAVEPDSAFDMLQASINHQGIASPVAARVAPFLLELIEARQGPVAALSLLLANLSAGGRHASRLLGEPRCTGWLGDVIERARSSYEALLASPRSEERSVGAIGLSCLDSGRERSVELLQAAVASEPKNGVAATMLASLLALELRGAPSSLARFEALASERTIRGLIAHLAAVRLRPAPASLEALLERTRAARPVATTLLYGGGRVRTLVTEVLVDDASRRADVEGLTRIFETLDMVEARSAALSSIVPRAQRPLDLTSLPSPSRATLERLARHTQRLSRDRFVAETDLVDHGVLSPARQLGLEPPGALEEVVDGRVVWQVLRDARDGLCALDQVTALAASLPEDQRVQLVTALHASPRPYSLGLRWPARERDGYDGVLEEESAFLSLTEAVARALPPAALERWLERRQDACPGALLALPSIPARLEPQLVRALSWLHLAPHLSRRLLLGVPEARREALVLALGFDLLLSRHSERGHACFPRLGWPLASLVPTRAVADRCVRALRERPLPRGSPAFAEAREWLERLFVTFPDGATELADLFAPD